MNEQPQVFFRTIRRLPPVVSQFLPQGQRNIVSRRPLTPEEQWSWDHEISTYDTLEAGIRNARAANLGDYQAEIVLLPGSPIIVRRDPASPHHVNLQGDAAAILAAVVRVWHASSGRIVWERPQ